MSEHALALFLSVRGDGYCAEDIIRWPCISQNWSWMEGPGQ